MQIQNSSTENYRSKAIQYLRDKAKTDKSKAELSLDLLLNNGVGIGDHSNILDELKKWTTKLSEAQENLLVLEKYFVELLIQSNDLFT